MDAEYAEQCRPIEEANKQFTDAWQAEWSAIAAKYQKLCKRIDDDNYRQLQHGRTRCDPPNEFKRLTDAWTVAYAAITADYEKVCRGH